MLSRPSSSPRDTRRGELALIRHIRSCAVRSASGPLRLGIGDDCALLRPRPGHELAITTDLTIAGIHFRLDWHTPESAGHRALARGLSDLAAMGASPVAAFLSLGLPREFANPKGGWSSSWVARFLDGLLALAETHKTPLAGGDVSETPVPLADIVLIGSVPAGRALLRSTARPGHLLYVTGSIGGGAAALPHLERLARQSNARAGGMNPPRIPRDLEPLLARHLSPQPRIAQGLWLQRRALASAAIDLSDGLSTDLTHLCEESRVAAEVDPSLLPIHPGASMDYALHGGDDYELLFTAPPAASIPKKIAGVPITRIGRILPARPRRPAITLLTPKGPQPLNPEGWEHFS
ncbi:MAG TPA: thiamine-phosphate kinase [Terracidiphilus sp.]|nr:thiamine-phosphate kinase [Terracidiphilus sp.]